MTKKLFSTTFYLNTKVIALMYICWYYKYPLTILLTFYETYKDMSLFALKALSICKKIKLTDNTFVKILEESSKLYNQIVKGVDTKIKIKQLKLNNPKNEPIPNPPSLNLEGFSNDYKRFITDYFLENIEDIYAPEVKLYLSSDDLYTEVV